jgi:hypothetical protein
VSDRRVPRNPSPPAPGAERGDSPCFTNSSPVNGAAV